MSAEPELVAALAPIRYVDPVWMDRERTAIFERSWIAVGLAAHLREPGSVRAERVAEVRVAVHRAPDGTLRAVRDDGGRLQPIAVESWAGIVFAHLGPDAPPLADWLGDLVDLGRRYPVDDFVFTVRQRHRIAANWKTYADNYLEGYHIPLIHPGLSRAIDTGAYEVTVSSDGRVHRHQAPARDGSATDGTWAYRWPNLAVNLYRSGMKIERWMPRGHDGVEVVYDYLFVDPQGPAAQAAVAASGAVLDEDRRIVEAVQANLNSGRYRPGPLSPRHEHGVRAFHDLIRQAVPD
jgi:choline monooxygenase